jgi:eukaryotic-like serine/threonine-protein kinase
MYEVTVQIGEGGMGQVYRATDTKLKRQVAIKILPPSMADDPDRLVRFQREAEVLAALNHPNIAGIYGLEESNGVTALVMELVEGEDLSQRIARGAIPMDEALPIAKQIAAALEAAHEQGIIHRDLKPANIKVRPDGTVKVLDFGLAKAMDPALSSAVNAMNSPTLTAATIHGVLLGTAGYMSPEQARGKAVDKRADIWAFGVVLYEMLTGRRAFEGDDISTTLAAVLRSEPEWSALPLATSPGVRQLLTRCLYKDPHGRMRDIGEARIAIDRELSGAGEPPTTSLASHRAPQWRRVATLAAALLTGAALTAVLVWFVGRPTVERPRVTRLNITPPSAAALSVGVSRDLAMTADGSRLVYVGGNGSTLFVRSLDRLEAIPLVRAGAPRDPFVSPDGQWVGFFDGGFTLKKVPITGGPAVLVARLDSYERGATWAPDGTIIFATQATITGLQRVSADGGAPAVLTQPNGARGEVGHAWPEMLPGGQAVLYSALATTGGLEAASIAALDLRSGRSTILLGGGSHAQYMASGHLVFGMAGALRAVAFDATHVTVVGQSIPVVPQVLTTSFGAVDAVVARDGTLAYVTGGVSSNADRVLVWVDRQGKETALESPPRAYYFPRISLDGRHVAMAVVVDQNSDVWTWDVTRATLARVTSDPSVDGFPMWTPDGRRVVFSSNRAGAFNLFSQGFDGTGAVDRLTESSNAQYPSSVVPDGMRVVFSETSRTTGDDVMMLPLEGTRRAVPLVQTAFDERNGVVSPDGRWLAYEANDTGSFEVYVRPFPDVNSGHWQVSTSGGKQPLWAPGGRELTYFAPTGELMHVAVGTESAWTAGPPVKLLDARYVVSPGGNVVRNYDIAPDGKRFLMMKASGADATGAPPQIVVIQHFDDELKRLLPIK